MPDFGDVIGTLSIVTLMLLNWKLNEMLWRERRLRLEREAQVKRLLKLCEDCSEENANLLIELAKKRYRQTISERN